MNAALAATPCPQCGMDVPADAPEGLCPKCLVGLNLGGPSHHLADEGAPAAVVVPSSMEPAGLAALFPQLEIVECLGRGGMGVVYKARQPRLNRWVALKVLAPGRDRNPHFAERFAREAQALARLTHPAIVAIHDFGEVGGHCFLVMELVDGVNLRTRVRRERMTPEQAMELIGNLCDALQYAHEQGVIHRDIKPENILIDARGRVKIADFGIAKLLGPAAPGDALTEARGVVGTPHYMAPEQVERPTEVDRRADLYALGVVFYELLTSELPLGRFPPPSSQAQVPPRLDALVMRSLEKDPARRFESAAEMGDSVRASLEDVRGRHTGASDHAAPPRTSGSGDRGSPGAPVREVVWIGRALMVLALFNLAACAILLGTGAVVVALDRRGVDLDGGWVPLAEWLQDADAGGMRSGLAVASAAWITASLITGLGGWLMTRFRSYRTALSACALAMLVPPGCVLGFPVGWWGLVVLGRRRTQAVFREEHARPRRANVGLGRRFAIAAALVLIPLTGMLTLFEWMGASRGHHARRAVLIEAQQRRALEDARAAEERAREEGRSVDPGANTPKPAATNALSIPLTEASVPPVVIATSPIAGETGVDPRTREIRVTFSKPMQRGRGAWVVWRTDTFPVVTGPLRLEPDGRTFVLPVRLEPGRTYTLAIDPEGESSFTDQAGRPAVSYLLTFHTRAD